MSPSPFNWDLTALKAGDAVKKALAMKEIQVAEEGAKVDPYGEKGPSWGGSVFGDRKPIATLAVSWMMALKAGCVQPTTRGYAFCNHLSRVLYVVGLCASLGVSIATLVEPNYYEPQHLDWFAWTSWATVATWMPDGANTSPTANPRALASPCDRWSWSSHWSAGSGRWNQMAWSRLVPMKTSW